MRPHPYTQVGSVYRGGAFLWYSAIIEIWSAAATPPLWLSSQLTVREEHPLAPTAPLKAKAPPLAAHSKWHSKKNDTYLYIRVWSSDPGHNHQSTIRSLALVSAVKKYITVFMKRCTKPSDLLKITNIKSPITDNKSGERANPFYLLSVICDLFFPFAPLPLCPFAPVYGGPDPMRAKRLL